MNAGNVTGSGATQAYYQNLNAKRTGGKADGESVGKSGGAAQEGDVYTSGAKASGAIYSKGSAASMDKLWGMAEAHYSSMRSAVLSLVGSVAGTPGVGASGSNGQAFWAIASGGGNDQFKVDKATQEKAQEMIGEDGYYGVRRTTERIMEFAEALAGSGANEKTIENLRGGVKAGFDSVAKLFGGFDKLPDVTKETYDAIMKKFDEWVGGLTPETAS